MIRVRSRSAGDTEALAGRLAPLLGAGDAILLGGDLGAGKTVFVKGLARAMGILEPVTSPTFTLVRTYEAPAGPPLVHGDLYRLDHMQEVLDLGLPEIMEAAVAAIEWGDVAAPTLPRDYLEVRIDFGDGSDDRALSMLAVGSRWAARSVALRAALGCGGGS